MSVAVRPANSIPVAAAERSTLQHFLLWLRVSYQDIHQDGIEEDVKFYPVRSAISLPCGKSTVSRGGILNFYGGGRGWQTTRRRGEEEASSDGQGLKS